MGGIFSSRKHNRNKVSNSGGVSEDATLESENVEVRIPDSRRQKVKSKSFYDAFTKSFKKSNRSQSPSSSPNIHSENDRLRQEIDSVKSDYERQIEDLKKDKDRLQEENTNLRNEVKSLNSAIPKLRANVDKAKLAEKDALERANALEQEKDKKERIFKRYREVKEEEAQKILKENQLLKTRLRDFVNTDGSVQDFLEPPHCQSTSEWLLDNQSVTEMCFFEKLSDQLNERETYTKLQTLLASLHHIEYGVPKTNTYTIYITFTEDMSGALEPFMEQCRQLMFQYEREERFLTFYQIPWGYKAEYDSICEELFVSCSIFVGLIGYDSDGQLLRCFFEKVIDFSGHCIFTCLEKPSLNDLKIDKKKHHLNFGFNTINELVSASLESLKGIVKLFFEKQQIQVQLEKDHQINHSFNEIPCRLSNWQILEIEEQHCLQENCKEVDYIISIENELKYLKEYISKDGHVQPLLVTGRPGSGKSFLLNSLVSYLESLSNVCILYHVSSVGCPSSRSTCNLLRRFIYIMRDVIPGTSNAVQLEKDFPRFLERVCDRYSNGIIIVIDGADLLDDVDHLKWLLDPLLVPVRVVLSVSNESCPEKWRSWPIYTLGHEDKDPLHLFMLKCNHISGEDTGAAILEKIFPDGIPNRVLENLSNHLFREVCALICYESALPDGPEERLKHAVTKVDVKNLYLFIIECLHFKHEKLLLEVLYFLYICHCGVHFAEFQDLLPLYNFMNVYAVLSDLIKYQIVVNIHGLYQLSRKEVQDAVMETFNQFSFEESRFRKTFIDIFISRLKFSEEFVSYRVADELPWQLYQMGSKEDLQTCISCVSIFFRLYQKGNHTTLMDYWKSIGKDLKGVHDIYSNIFSNMENKEFKEMLAILYDMLGEFILDQGQHSLAQVSFEKSLDLKETHFEPEDPRIGYSILCLGRLFTSWKKFQTAEQYYNQLLEEKDHYDQADTIAYAKCLECLAILYHIQDGIDAMQSCRKQAFQIRQLYFNEHTYITMKTMSDELYKSVKSLIEEKGVNEELMRHLNEIGSFCFKSRQLKEAIDVFQTLLNLSVQEYGKENPQVANVMYNLSHCYQLIMDYEKAEYYRREALEILLKIETIDSASVQTACRSLVELFEKQEKFVEIEDWYRKIVDIKKEFSGDGTLPVAKANNELAIYLSEKKKYGEALDFFQESVMIYNKQVGFQDRKVSKVICNMAKVFKAQDKRMMAAQMYKLSNDKGRKLEQYLSILR